MAAAPSHSTEGSTRIKWEWNANVNPFSKSQPVQWKPYSDVENLIIEEAFSAGKIYAMFDDYHIDFKHKMQISNHDKNKQRPVQQKICNINDVNVREERFTFTPIDPKRPFGGLYGWISPFVKEVAKHLNITKDQLPSKDQTMVLMIVEKAAAGIIEEGKLLGKKFEGEQLAKMLLEKKDAGIKEIWKRCAYLYSLESYLYKKLNETMRLIGSKEHEQEWRSKIPTLGPFCLLLWDNPFNDKTTKRGTVIYRGAKLTDDLILAFKYDCSKEDKPLRSFQSFTSCSRNRAKAEPFGNVLFIMTVKHAFSVDLKQFSKYPNEEEELILPGVCFTVDRVEFDKKKKKHLIYLNLVQQFRCKLIFISFIMFSIVFSSHFLVRL
ncbi:unnamed protein product [Rotaria sp. Silwood2]|nr:unnamed protein product [Rotaria sp. Silwood2]